ncbi:MAG TPA: heme-binding protein [Candidatus Acidoferrales bacterium]|nr:heme-binding protein [Candidatus Acidoferrales bacterium]
MSLVTRNNPKLTLEGARAVLAAAEKTSQEIRCPMNIAVVDDGGHLLAFARMDGAKLASIEIALLKARSSAARRSPTGPVMKGEEANMLLSVGLALGNPGEHTPIRGGLPLLVGGQVVGAIGVSAGSEDQDVEVARAGAAALEKA